MPPIGVAACMSPRLIGMKLFIQKIDRALFLDKTMGRKMMTSS